MAWTGRWGLCLWGKQCSYRLVLWGSRLWSPIHRVRRWPSKTVLLGQEAWAISRGCSHSLAEIPANSQHQSTGLILAPTIMSPPLPPPSGSSSRGPRHGGAEISCAQSKFLSQRIHEHNEMVVCSTS